MNFDNYTIKTQQALQQAQQIAQEFEHQQIENEHLYKGMQAVDQNVIPYLLKKLDVNSTLVDQIIDKEIERFPKVSGSDQMLSRTLIKTLGDAVAISKKTAGEYVSIEDIFLALFKSKSKISQILKDQGETEKD